MGSCALYDRGQEMVDVRMTTVPKLGQSTGT